MLHTKFQDQWTSGFYHMWAWRPAWSCDLDHGPPSLGGYTCNWALIGQAVLKKKIFENGVQATDNGQTPEHWYTISSPDLKKLL